MTTEEHPVRENGWTTTSSREIYANPWIRLREDAVVRPDGREGIYGVVEVRNPSVFIVAIDERERIVLVDLYRYTTASWSTEVPAGSTDGEEPVVAARRELAEETGLVADSWTHIGDMTSLNGISDAPEHVFLARGLRAAADDGSSTRAEEGIAEVRRVPWREALGLVASGGITDAETIAALMFAAIASGRLEASDAPRRADEASPRAAGDGQSASTPTR